MDQLINYRGTEYFIILLFLILCLSGLLLCISSQIKSRPIRSQVEVPGVRTVEDQLLPAATGRAVRDWIVQPGPALRLAEASLAVWRVLSRSEVKLTGDLARRGVAGHDLI